MFYSTNLNIRIPDLGYIIIIAVFILGLAALLFYIYHTIYKKNKNNLSFCVKCTSNDNQKNKGVSIKMSKSMQVAELNKDLEPFGFAYYPRDDFFYSIMYGWQRKCGYCELYDEGAAPLCMIIDCEPIRFEYGGKRWLIEFWKGQYGMNTGCEIGVYTTDGPNLNIPEFFDGTFYYGASEEDFLPMGFSLRKNGTLIFTRNELHWWLTGFKLGLFSDPSELVMSAELTLKDTNMRDAFIDAMLETGYSSKDIIIHNNTIKFIFKKPHSPQPITRTFLTEHFMQTINHRNCDAYQSATKGYKNTLDKLEYVKTDAPKLYHKIINVGNTKELFAGYDLIKKYLAHDESNNS